LEYVDLEEFLTENGIPTEHNGALGNPSPPDMSNSNISMSHSASPTDSAIVAGPSRMSGHLHGSSPIKSALAHHKLRSRSSSPVGSQISSMNSDCSADSSPESSQHGRKF